MDTFTLASIFLIISALTLILTAEPTKCLKDKDLEEYPVNVYYCEDPEKPMCCEKDYTFNCCPKSTTKNLAEQVQLWGSVTGVIVLIIFVWVCYRRDTYLCEGDTIKERMSNCLHNRPKKDKEDENVELHEMRDDGFRISSKKTVEERQSIRSRNSGPESTSAWNGGCDPQPEQCPSPYANVSGRCSSNNGDTDNETFDNVGNEKSGVLRVVRDEEKQKF